MNLLAHAVLSPDASEVLFGNLTADWVKGRARQALPAGVQRGMALHQVIDRVTDAHRAFDRCAKLLEPTWGRYAEILVDVLFDHVLSVDWHWFSTEPRPTLIARSYAALRAHQHVLPERTQYPVNMLLADDWLSCYASLDGIALTFTRMSQRLQSRGHEIELAPAVRDFVVHQEAFHAALREIWPALTSAVKDFENH